MLSVKRKEIKKRSYEKHKVTTNLKTQAYYQQNKDKTRNFHYKKKYGITLEQYNILLEAQNHSCKVCGKHRTEFNRNLAVDHDHQTLEIRGLICWSCNRRVIGNLRDPELFRKAASYLDGPFTGFFTPKPVRRKRKRKKNVRPKTT